MTRPGSEPIDRRILALLVVLSAPGYAVMVWAAWEGAAYVLDVLRHLQ